MPVGCYLLSVALALKTLILYLQEIHALWNSESKMCLLWLSPPSAGESEAQSWVFELDSETWRSLMTEIALCLGLLRGDLWRSSLFYWIIKLIIIHFKAEDDRAGYIGAWDKEKAGLLAEKQTDRLSHTRSVCATGQSSPHCRVGLHDMYKMSYCDCFDWYRSCAMTCNKAFESLIFSLHYLFFFNGVWYT